MTSTPNHSENIVESDLKIIDILEIDPTSNSTPTEISTPNDNSYQITDNLIGKIQSDTTQANEKISTSETIPHSNLVTTSQLESEPHVDDANLDTNSANPPSLENHHEMNHPRSDTNPIPENTKSTRISINKPYMGGYKNKETGIEYFHATTQTTTAQEIRAKNYGARFHRDTQTHYIRNRASQCVRESSTQVATPGIFLSTGQDKVIQPQTYTTASQHHQHIVSSVIKIQCFFRKVKAQRVVQKMRSEKVIEDKERAEFKLRKKELKEKLRRQEIESRQNPKTAKDFQMLYSTLEVWRKGEVEKINKANYPEEKRLKLLAELLKHEAILLQKLDRLKISAKEEHKERKTKQLLEQMADTKKWPLNKGGFALVDTPDTVRARELKKLYTDLTTYSKSLEERLQVLVQLRHIVKEFDCNLTRDIIQLIDRESDLISRGRDPTSLEGLRKRIANLFLQFIETPEFNPEAKHFQRVPSEIEADRTRLYHCRSCARYLPSFEFALNTTMKQLGNCKSCTQKANIAVTRSNESAYLRLLRVSQLFETMRHPPVQLDPLDSDQPTVTIAPSTRPRQVQTQPRIINLLTEQDIQYIVDTLWNRRSPLSGVTDLNELLLIRWNDSQELSPWNCILLTEQEALIHSKLRHQNQNQNQNQESNDPQVNSNLNVEPGLGELYSTDFINRVKTKLLTAKQKFSQVHKMEGYLKRQYVVDEMGLLKEKLDPGIEGGKVSRERQKNRVV